MTDSTDRAETDPPRQVEQALEAARDDPTRTELVNMVHGLPAVTEVLVDGEDEDWRETIITVGFRDSPRMLTAQVIEIMQRAGWRTDDVTFAYNRVQFRERESDE